MGWQDEGAFTYWSPLVKTPALGKKIEEKCRWGWCWPPGRLLWKLWPHLEVKSPRNDRCSSLSHHQGTLKTFKTAFFFFFQEKTRKTVFVCLFFKINFRFTVKLRERYRDFPYVSCLTHTEPPSYKHPSPDSTFVTDDESTLTHTGHPASIVHVGVYSWCCAFCGLGRCIHHSSIIQNIITALKIPSALPVHPSQPPIPGTTDLSSVSMHVKVKVLVALS